MAPTLRPGRPTDAEMLARLHVTVWRETYGHIAPPEAMRQLDEARRLPFWRDTLASPDRATGAILAEQSGTALGVIAFGRPTQPELSADLEIKHLYLLPAARGTGLGRALLKAALAQARAQSIRDVSLAVVRHNTAARRFYAAMGGTESGSFIDAGPLWRSENIVVRWRLSPAPEPQGT